MRHRCPCVLVRVLVYAKQDRCETLFRSTIRRKCKWEARIGYLSPSTDTGKCNFVEDLIDYRSEKWQSDAPNALALLTNLKLVLKQNRMSVITLKSRLLQSSYRFGTPDMQKNVGHDYTSRIRQIRRDRLMSGRHRAFRENYRVLAHRSLAICPFVSRLRKACFEYRSKVNGPRCTYVCTCERSTTARQVKFHVLPKSFHRFHE